MAITYPLHNVFTLFAKFLVTHDTEGETWYAVITFIPAKMWIENRKRKFSSGYLVKQNVLTWITISPGPWLIYYSDAAEAIGHDLHGVVLQCLLWWTCHSEIASAGLSKSGIITNISNLLPIYIELNIYNKVRGCNIYAKTKCMYDRNFKVQPSTVESC